MRRTIIGHILLILAAAMLTGCSITIGGNVTNPAVENFLTWVLQIA